MPAGLKWGRPVVFALDLVAGWAVVATNVGRGPALGSVGEGLRCDFPPPRLSPRAAVDSAQNRPGAFWEGIFPEAEGEGG
jgi:hypothetical protein